MTDSPELLQSLEIIDSPDALAWAQEWSDATEGAADNPELRERILAALDVDDRIPFVARRAEWLYNFWRDAEHVRGLWRRTTLTSYLSDSPEWEVLVDVDKLAADEDENWVWKGAHVRAPDYDLALVRLSRGGADATVVREFDLAARKFVTADPFELPEAKTDVSWIDADTLLVGTDTGAGSLTSSGYPAQVRVWRRGTELLDAPVYTAGRHEDVAVGAWADTTPGHERIIVSRALDFYRTRQSVAPLDPDAPLQVLELPEDCRATLHREWLFVAPREEYAGIPAGGLGVIELDRFLGGERGIRPVFTPTGHVSLQAMSFTREWLVVTLLDDVATRVLIHPLDDPTSPGRDLELPPLVTASVVATSPLDGDEVWLTTSSFTEPTTLYRLDLADGLSPELVRRSPALFDAAGLETRQHWVTSADGTRLPYFITGDFSRGPRPTLVGGYGGFEVSLTPGYSAVRGIGWLETGRHFVQPNLRGGGEFGPTWHTQVVKTNRHKVWEDHRAVLEDLVARGYAAPEQIAIRGGSNGGLLTSGALTRYPECFGAAVIQVPLTDMLRYHTWSAGASWMAEYGDPAVAEERAAIETWSPLHNVSPSGAGGYPPALVTTSTRDDRVHPAHARLFAHALREAGQPVDYFENTEGGHAGAADNKQVARVEALIFEWLNQHVG
ncbi:prolyl oligopeptidase family serine peptidase [Corynebacterium marinum]|uniref:Peptidase n=1 Tax=Corynebacterium marinum DSM 44953 TaxID=1224162 RepID=A0A0B6TJ14_9CORY|nr:prolyl oligopeptidase family serine peptidase [Corynebacterium marinum]AJK67903.1 peptidase [Corynebacterium marinum DSM 44953]GGO11726.1 serine protease [Corynebacterium marinum]